MAPRTAIVPLIDLKETFFVRRVLNEDQVLQLAMLYEAGEELPPLTVTRDLQIVDGRHRKAALELSGRKEAKVHFTDEDDKGKLLLAALKANLGGSLPPSRADIMLTLEGMLSAGLSMIQIQRSLPFPASVSRRYLSDVQSKLSKRRMAKALESVATGATLAQAATEQGVELKDLQELVTGRRRKKKLLGPEGLNSLKASVTKRYRSQSQVNAKMMEQLLRSLEDGELTAPALFEILDHMQKAAARQVSAADDWRRRVVEALARISSVESIAS